MQILKLLPIESSILARNIISISTITFFDGDLNEVKDFIFQRFHKVCSLNPWLLGCLINEDSKHSLSLKYSQDIEEKILSKSLQFNITDLNFYEKMTYSEILVNTAPYMVKKPNIIANTDALVSALTLQTLANNPKKFAMIFSVSHSVVDGHSYYKILNMLFGNEEILSLNVQRKAYLNTELQQAVSLPSYRYFTGLSHIANAARSSLFGKKSKTQAYYIDPRKIELEKDKKDTTLDFLSSNDIITSSFFGLIQARVGFMAVNFRAKIKGLDEQDAGNYEGAICYDSTHYATPSLIRTSLLNAVPYHNTFTTLPHFIEAFFCKLGLISNWSTFAKALNIVQAKQTLHLPIIGEGSSPYDICIIFRATHKQKGIILIHKTLTEEQIQKSMPLSEVIC